jgi:hypothetical protein
VVPVNRNTRHAITLRDIKDETRVQYEYYSTQQQGKIMYNKKIWQKKTSQEETNKIGERERASRLEQYAKKTANKK